MNEKACTRCGAVKPLSDFHRNRANKDGLQYHRKPCLSAEVLPFARAQQRAYRKLKQLHPDEYEALYREALEVKA